MVAYNAFLHVACLKGSPAGGAAGPGTRHGHVVGDSLQHILAWGGCCMRAGTALVYMPGVLHTDCSARAYCMGNHQHGSWHFACKQFTRVLARCSSTSFAQTLSTICLCWQNGMLSCSNMTQMQLSRPHRQLIGRHSWLSCSKPTRRSLQVHIRSVTTSVTLCLVLVNLGMAQSMIRMPRECASMHMGAANAPSKHSH